MFISPSRLRALYRTIPHMRLSILSIAMGLLAGGAAILFFLGVEAAKHGLLTLLAGVEQPAASGEMVFAPPPAGDLIPRLWIIPIALALVGLFTGWLVKRFVPDSIDGVTDGTDSLIRIFHQKQGVMPPRLPLIKSLTSILTIAAGGSAGREGPISQLCGGIGSWFALRLRLNARERRILMLAGAAGGLGAIFRAPLGGALTAIEVMYREDFEAEALIPAVLSSVVAYSLFTLAYGAEPILLLPEFTFHNVLELPFYVLLAIVCALAGWLYIRAFRFLKYSAYGRLRARLGIVWTAGLGGLAAGIFGALYPPVLSDGYGWLEQAILGQLSVTAMLAMALSKTVATSLTLGSGLSGGMFAPALFVGGMTGGCVGYASHHFRPDIVTQPGAYVLVGMTAFFAGVAHAPIGPLVMICEITKGYGLLAPLMLCAVVTMLLSRKTSLYENQEENKFTSPAHREDATVNLLAAMAVSDRYKPSRVAVVEESVTLGGLVDIIAGTNALTFPVRGSDGRLSGILAVEDVRALLYKDELFDLVLVSELARPLLTVPHDGDLYAALIAFVESDLAELPVVDPQKPDHVLGLLQRADLFRAYHQALKQAKEE